MVLVAPSPLLPSAPLTARAPKESGSGREVLALLRGDMAARPNFDPGLAGGVRAWLEDAAYEATSQGTARAGPLVLGSRQLLGSVTAEDTTSGTSRIVHRFVHVLFRQLVHGATITDPLDDGLEALRAAGDHAAVEDVEALDERARHGIAATLARHVTNLTSLVPRFAPGWMPRTDDYIAIPLAGGRVVLHGVFDLLVGVPQTRTASLCALGLSTGGPWDRERRSLHFLALLQLLRAGSPPFRVALFESASGRYGVEDIREEHIRAMAAHVAGWLAQRDAVHE
jgi:hypothetical protein